MAESDARDQDEILWSQTAPPISRSRSGSFSRLLSRSSRRISKTFRDTLTKEFLIFREIMEKKAKDITELDFVRQFTKETDSLKRRFFPHEEDYEREQFSWEEEAVEEAQTIEELLEKNEIPTPRRRPTTTLPWRRNPSKSNVRFFAFTDPLVKLAMDGKNNQVFHPKQRVTCMGQSYPLHGATGTIEYVEGPFAYVEFQTDDRKQTIQLPRRMLEPERTHQGITNRRKLAFVVGCLDLYFTLFFLFRRPESFLVYHTITFVTMFLHRCYDFYLRHWQWCLIEVCYAINFYVLYVAWFTPENVAALKVCFLLCNGPILWGGIIFQNGLVFHSFTKTASLRLHFSPPLLLYLMRNVLPSGIPTSLENLEMTSTDVFNAVSFFASHQFFWWTIMGWFFKRTFWDDPKSSNCLSCLVESREGAFFKAVNILGENWWELIFACLYTFGASLAMLIAIPLFYSVWLHISVLFILHCMYLWNGADFYDFLEQGKWDG